MPVHDWTRVNAGTYHHFHALWIAHLSETLNSGVLPSGYYALAEQWAGHRVADVLALQSPVPPTGDGGVAVAERLPQVRRILTVSSASRMKRRTLVVRHTSGHRVIALVEIVSQANKDRPGHVAEFVDKAIEALESGIHLLVIDLFPPGPHDSQGMHGAIWERLDDAPYLLPQDEPLTLAAYAADRPPTAYVDHLAVGSPLPPMPLFLDLDRYVEVPLEPSYEAAYLGVPGFWREVIEGRQEPPPGSDG